MVDEDFVRLYERVDWFLKWLDTSCDCGGFIINEWLRGDPPCFGTWAREKYREYQSSNTTAKTEGT